MQQGTVTTAVFGRCPASPRSKHTVAQEETSPGQFPSLRVGWSCLQPTLLCCSSLTASLPWCLTHTSNLPGEARQVLPSLGGITQHPKTRLFLGLTPWRAGPSHACKQHRNPTLHTAKLPLIYSGKKTQISAALMLPSNFGRSCCTATGCQQPAKLRGSSKNVLASPQTMQDIFQGIKTKIL